MERFGPTVDVEQAFSRLNDAEARAGLQNDGDGDPGVYKNLGRWYLRRGRSWDPLQAMVQRGARSFGPYPTAWRSRLRFAWRWMHASERTEECDADVVYAGKLIRGFYLSQSQPVTVKTSRSEVDERLGNEAHARKVVGDVVSVPRILDDRSDRSPPFIVEQLVRGWPFLRRFRTKAMFRHLVGCISRWQSASGYDLHPGPDEEEAAELRSQVSGELADSGVSADEAEGIRYQVGGLTHGEDLAVPYSFCHGDLAPGNLVVRNGGVTILDWDVSREAISVTDFLRLLDMFPLEMDWMLSVIDAAVEEGIAREPGYRDVLRPMELLRLAVFMQIALVRYRRERLAADGSMTAAAAQEFSGITRRHYRLFQRMTEVHNHG